MRLLLIIWRSKGRIEEAPIVVGSGLHKFMVREEEKQLPG